MTPPFIKINGLAPEYKSLVPLYDIKAIERDPRGAMVKFTDGEAMVIGLVEFARLQDLLCIPEERDR